MLNAIEELDKSIPGTCSMLARFESVRFEQNSVHGGTTPHRRCYGLDTPGYVPLAGSSHLSPGAIICRHFVAGRLLRQAAA